MLHRFVRRIRDEEGFTLIELMVVVAIIALLAAFAAPRLFSAIKTAKATGGTADLQTISSAMERYYFQNSNYPHTDAATVQGNLIGTYVKAGTTFVNGFKNGFLLFSDTSGSFYVMVDPRDNTGSVKVSCGDSSSRWTSTAVTIGSIMFYQGEATKPTDTQINAGCGLYPGTATTYTSSNILDAQVVTN